MEIVRRKDYLDMGLDPQCPPELADLIVVMADRRHVVRRAEAPVTIGRDSPADLRIANTGVSRTHAQVAIGDDGLWRIDDLRSMNGTFFNGQKVDSLTISDGLTVHLGDPEGIPVVFAFAEPSAASEVTAATKGISSDQASQRDIALARVGSLVAERRNALGKVQRDLVEDGIVRSQTTIVDLETGKRWPHSGTRARIEQYLQLEPGQLDRWRAGEGSDTDAEGDAGEVGVVGDTVVIPDAVRDSVVTVTKVALDGIKARIDMLPSVDDRSFASQARELLHQLRMLEAGATEAARSARGPELVLLLRDVRHTYSRLMMRAADGPNATLGQKLYAMRQRSELTPEEVAAGAQVDVATITSAEAEKPIPATAASALQAFISIVDPQK